MCSSKGGAVASRASHTVKVFPSKQEATAGKGFFAQLETVTVARFSKLDPRVVFAQVFRTLRTCHSYTQQSSTPSSGFKCTVLP